jgi:hypothetical protein
MTLLEGIFCLWYRFMLPTQSAFVAKYMYS